MQTVLVTGYHTCKTDGGWSYVKTEGPFLSGSDLNQWLTQGYYFWTDSCYFAHKWGEDSYNKSYAILKCSIEIEADLLLDLVGSTEAQLYFERLLTKFRTHLNKVSPNKEPSVHAVIAHWREISIKNKSVFPFVAIKVQDGFRGSKLSFVSKREFINVGIQRQQLCLFEDGLCYLTKKELIYPEEFKIRSNL